MARKPLQRRSPGKLTRKQRGTVSENLQKRIQRLQQEGATEATVISHMGYNVVVQATPQSPLQGCDWRQNIGAICAGDQVLISPTKGDNNPVIEAVLPRKTVIEKQNVYRGTKPFAANIEQMLVVVSHQPMLQPSLLDRYLITAATVGIDCLIFFNKTDLLSDAETTNYVADIQAVYEKIPQVRWVSGSVKTACGLDELTALLDNRKTVITGQSGVGKSSLINVLIPDINVQTSSISAASGLGKHSTTNSTLYRLDAATMHSGVLIDTPGVRSFDTYHLSSEQINNGFSDVKQFLGLCRFSDCSHTHESHCAVKDAVADNQLSELRYRSFLQILQESQQHD